MHRYIAEQKNMLMIMLGLISVTTLLCCIFFEMLMVYYLHEYVYHSKIPLFNSMVGKGSVKRSNHANWATYDYCYLLAGPELIPGPIKMRWLHKIGPL